MHIKCVTVASITNASIEIIIFHIINIFNSGEDSYIHLKDLISVTNTDTHGTYDDGC